MADSSTDFLSGYQGNQVERADIGTQGAQNALVDVEFDVGETAQASGSFATCLLLSETELDLG